MKNARRYIQRTDEKGYLCYGTNLDRLRKNMENTNQN
jgi:hypothetical protein